MLDWLAGVFVACPFVDGRLRHHSAARLLHVITAALDLTWLTGTTTSGCVRATVLDAFSLNFRIALAEEGCFDRSQASHAINLCDMNAKYADVVKTAEALAFLDRLPAGMFELPEGAEVTPPALTPKGRE